MTVGATPPPSYFARLAYFARLVSSLNDPPQAGAVLARIIRVAARVSTRVIRSRAIKGPLDGPEEQKTECRMRGVGAVGR